jgi:hypothetical protein
MRGRGRILGIHVTYLYRLVRAPRPDIRQSSTVIRRLATNLARNSWEVIVFSVEARTGARVHIVLPKDGYCRRIKERTYYNPTAPARPVALG